MTVKATQPWGLGQYKARKQRLAFQNKGLPAMVPAERVAKHVDSLTAVGVTDSMIARAAGITSQTVALIRDRKYPNVTLIRANAILAVTVHPQPTQHLVLAIGARRRVEALQALGWTLPDLGDRLGMNRRNLRHLVTAQTTCSYARWAQIRDLYDELSITPFGELSGGPAARARALAKRSGWLLPMEWEGFDIDDPRVLPRRSHRTKSAAKGKEAKERRQEKVAELVRVGLSEVEIAARLRVTDRTVTRDKAYLRQVAS